MSKNNQERLEEAIKIAKQALRPYVERELHSKYGPQWRDRARAALQGKNPNLNDTPDLVKIMINLWEGVFSKKLEGKRSLVFDLREIRNAVFHNRPFEWSDTQTDEQQSELYNLYDTNRALYSLREMLSAIGAPEAAHIQKQINEVILLIAQETSAGTRKAGVPEPKQIVPVKPQAESGAPQQGAGSPTPGPVKPPQALRTIKPNRGRDPYLYFQPAYLLTPDLIRRFDAEVHRRMPDRLGWVLIDACNNKPSGVWVHVRPYINDRTSIPIVSRKRRGVRRRIPRDDYKYVMPQSFRLSYMEDFTTLTPGPGYIAILSKRDGEDISQEVYEFAQTLQAKQVPFFTLNVPSDSPKVFIIEEWGDVALPSDVLPLSARPLSIVLSGKNEKRVKEYLPFDVVVEADAPSAALDMTIDNASGFTSDSYHFLVRDHDAHHLGEIRLRVDALQRAGKPDEITVEPLSMERAISVHNWDASQITGPPFDEVMLHLVFDRTTLDDASWPTAFETLAFGRIEELKDLESIIDSKSMVNENTGITKSWNHNFRNALATALPQTVAEIHSDVRIYLWWFADIPRDGIAPSDELPYEYSRPYACVGECSVTSLAERLNDHDFNYVTGFDLFDAVDEALLEIAKLIDDDVNRNYHQHAVLIVGDSPPPPSGTEDVLWRDLVDGDVRTNARCSDQFNKALESLNNAGVPVGWLFMRSGSHWQETSNRSWGKQFQAISQFKEQILITLQKIEGLEVKGCAGLNDLNTALSELFHKMVESKSKVPGFKIARTNPA